jgi:DNA-binding CsgD family transcriptional regulator
VQAAVRLADAAFRLTPPDQPSAIAEHGLALARYAAMAGDVERAAKTAEQLLGFDLHSRDRARVLVEASGFPVDVEIVEKRCVEGLSLEGVDPATAAALHRSLATAYELEGRLRNASTHLTHAIREAERAADGYALVAGVSQLGRVRFLLGHGIDMDLMRRGLERESADPYLFFSSASSSLADQLRWSDELDAARSIYERLRARAAGIEADLAQVAILLQLADLESRAGRWHAVRAFAVEAEELNEETGRDVWAPLPRLYRALADIHAGRFDAARAGAKRSLDEFHAHRCPFPAVHAESVLGFSELAAGRPDEAVRHLSPLPTRLDAMGVRDPGYFWLVPSLIEALVEVDRLADASNEIERLERLARPLRRHRALAAAERGRALVALAEGQLGDAIDACERALAHHERFPDVLARAETLLTLASAYRRTRRRREARETLGEALCVFEDRGAPLWAKKATAELARIGGRTASGTDLTETEERVAALVAEGLTNDEVAGRLFITSRTVEGHLSRIYAKLGVRSRVELALRVSKGEQPPQHTARA